MKLLIAGLIFCLLFSKVSAINSVSFFQSPQIFCGDAYYYREVKQEIATKGDDADAKVSNCTWLIAQPEKSVIWVEIVHLQLEGYGLHKEYNCLSFTNFWDYIYLRICNGDEIDFTSLSFPTNRLKITLELYNHPPATQIKVQLSYISYPVKCDLKHLICPSYYTGWDTKEPCYEALLNCGEQCRQPEKEVPCGDFCYNLKTKRCNDVIDCYKGEDEFGCNYTLCSNSINCPNTTECITKEQICNNVTDCDGGFDENLCKSINTRATELQSKEDDIDQMFYIILTIMTILSILFMSILVRCYTNSKDPRRIWENPPRTPLPPFYGPGSWDSDESSEGEPIYDDPDYKVGGDLYEGYATGNADVSEKTKTEKTSEIPSEKRPSEEKEVRFGEPPPPPYNATLYKKYFGLEEPPFISEELRALASIKMTKSNCIGLRKVKSEIDKKISKVLFLDHNDDQGESSTSEEETEDIRESEQRHNKKPSKFQNMKGKSKSDTVTNIQRNKKTTGKDNFV